MPRIRHSGGAQLSVAVGVAVLVGDGVCEGGTGVLEGTAVEVGARYLRIFTDSKAINMSNIFGGYRFGF